MEKGKTHVLDDEDHQLLANQDNLVQGGGHEEEEPLDANQEEPAQVVAHNQELGQNQEEPAQVVAQVVAPNQELGQNQQINLDVLFDDAFNFDNMFNNHQMVPYHQGMPRTELCRYWEGSNHTSCRYGELCRFAHGASQLLPVTRGGDYRRRLCPSVIHGVPCWYGITRCHFRHN